MRIEELRIGNIVTWKDEEDNFPVTIIGLHNGGDIFVAWKSGNEIDNTDCSLESIKPIPLTEDWLERFGFKEYHKSEWNIKYDNDEIDMQIAVKANRIMCLYGGKFLRDTPFVHQLQNLAYSITGEELKLNQ